MSTREFEPTVRQSILDRLVDTAPQLRADPPQSWRESVRALRESVMRDLEWLLNTRRVIQPAPSSMPQLQSSVYNFGLPDISSHSRESDETHSLLLRQIEECISTFEPRLTAVHVIAREAGEGETRHRVRFVIDALLKMEPDPERITFDTLLEITSGEFQISGGADA